jgi:hypothetical protein
LEKPAICADGSYGSHQRPAAAEDLSLEELSLTPGALQDLTLTVKGGDETKHLFEIDVKLP